MHESGGGFNLGERGQHGGFSNGKGLRHSLAGPGNLKRKHVCIQTAAYNRAVPVGRRRPAVLR